MKKKMITPKISIRASVQDYLMIIKGELLEPSHRLTSKKYF